MTKTPHDPAIEAAGQRQFAEWFAKNYPGPETIIYDPHWHAPRIFSAAIAAYEAAQWQPKKTAPRDGVRFLGVKRGNFMVCYWDKVENNFCWNIGLLLRRRPADFTHWRPLPAAPKPEGE